MGGRNRSNAVQNGQDNVNPLYNEEVARQQQHERQRAEHMKQLRQQHLQNIGGDKPKLNDQQLLQKEQQEKAFANKLQQENEATKTLENDVIDEMEQDSQEKNKKKVEKNKNRNSMSIGNM